MVVHDCQAGLGQGRYTIELVRRLSDRFAFHVFANRFDPGLPSEVRCHRVPAIRVTALTTVLSFLAAGERRVRRARCDLIHAQGLTCWSAEIVTAHICNQARLERSAPRGLRRRLFPSVIVPLERAFYRAQAKRHAIAISRVVGTELTRCYGWNRPMTVIPHGVDVDRFRPAKRAEEQQALRNRYKVSERDWVWLFVGEASKGVPALLEQLGAFPAARLLVISRSASEPMMSLARAMGVEGQVLWHGPEVEPELAYRAADLFAYPSDYDAFGMVVMEAMASGLPAIVSSHIGAAELIEDRVQGLLVDPKAKDSVRSALGWIRDHPRDAERMAGEGRRVAMASSWEACASRTAEVYDSLLGERMEGA